MREWHVSRNGHTYRGLQLGQSANVEILDADPCTTTGYIGLAYFGPFDEAVEAGFMFRRVASDT